MSKRFRYPRNEAARADKIAQHEIINTATRNIASRNDAIAQSPHNDGRVTAAISGSIVSFGALAAAVVAGGQSLVITLTGGTWAADIGADNSITAALIAGIRGTTDQAAGWNAQILAGDGVMDHTDVARTSDTIVTITAPASASYALTAEEEIMVTIPSVCIDKGLTPTPAPTSFFLADVTVAMSGTAVAGGVLESEIVTGSETLILTLTGGDTWHADIASAGTPLNNLIGSLNGDDAGANGWDDEMTIVAADVTRTSDTVVTIILPATAGYVITGDEIVTLSLTTASVNGNVNYGTDTFTISNEA